MKEEKDILGDLNDDIFRVDHMGHNAEKEKVRKTMDVLEAVVKG